MIKDFGQGLKPKNFIYQEFGKNSNNGKIGKFGAGLKDAIGVLWSKNINAKIRSNGYKFTFGMKEKIEGSSYKTLHAYIKKVEDDNFIGTEYKIYKCSNDTFEEAKLQFIKFQNVKILFTNNKGQILDKNIGDSASIYVNGMKIAKDSKLRFSYNITNPSSKIKKGINREREYVSRSVYRDDIENILKKADSEYILDILVDQLRRTCTDESFDESFDEINWKHIAIKTCNYIMKKEKVVFVCSYDIKNNFELCRLISQNRDFKIFKISNKVKQKLKSDLKLDEKTKNFIEDLPLNLKETISPDEITKDEKIVLSKVIKLLKTINVLKSEYYLLDNVRISNQTISYTDEENKIIIIPRGCLSSINDCSIKMINALASIRQGSSQFKDYIVGQLCLEFIELNSSDKKLS